MSTSTLVSELQLSAAPSLIAGCNLLLVAAMRPCNVLSIIAPQADTWHNGLPQDLKRIVQMVL